MDGLHKLEIIVLTTGEECTSKAIDRIIMYTPRPYKLRIWYNVLDSYDHEFAKKMLEYTKDLIVCHAGYGCTEGSMLFQLTCEAEFQLGLCSDTCVRDDYFNKLMNPMLNNQSIAWIGQGFPCSESDDRLVPDKIGIIRKKAIDDVGAISPLFKVYGHHGLEFMQRLRRKGWLTIGIPNIILEDYDNPKGRNIRDVKPSMALSDKQLLRLLDKDFEGFNWWNNEYTL